ncbi:hypothetical protein [Xanthobacter tagetidis]|uniref:Uncharacterized protein n=1 Tax=Xanthobacter tagetidis TaxID=60216 RepID=A0A3L7AIM1_9HYPH|nr:hypothetical protein [Xanthobacter tagetidis]MBB6306236.1 hypothetical protein [Xanthobacter tagetidis]RLP79518.1 hypothetical protein D9R14_07585 [Xanthobacter tagetidis]
MSSAPPAGSSGESPRGELLAEVVACNFDQGWLLRSDGVYGDIRRWIDKDGDDTGDHEDAVIAVVEWRDGMWSPVELGEPETVQ